MEHKSRRLLSFTSGLLLVGTMVVVNPILASTAASESSQAQHIKEAVTAKATQNAHQKSQNFNADAVAAINQVEQAASLLKREKYEDALNQLKSADKRLETAIAADPSLKLIPVVQDVSTYDLMTSPKEVKDEVNSIRKELTEGDVQWARVRLDQLRSELITNYVYLPVEIYPAAIKEAVKELEAKQYSQAEATIETAMHSLVQELEVIPLPVAMANDAILDAEAKRSTDSEQALWDLDYAHEQMLTAERLGYFYGDTEDYKAALQYIENLRHAMGGGNSEVDTLFTKAKEGVKHLVDKFQTTHHPVEHGK
jgi:tetratricopeptide (TPR) repeat protein